ncbi:MAG: hypothetical protein R6U04_06155 [Bacteroidales bacterium]
MKKLYISLLISAIFLISVFPQTSYAEEENNYYDIEDSEDYELGESVEVEGTLDPVQYFSDPTMVSPQCTACLNTNYKVSTVSGPDKVKRRVRFLTSSWAKADRYTWSTTQTASSTVSANVGLSAKAISSQLGVSNTVTSSYGVAISIPANSSRLSKLAFFADYNRRYVRVRKYMGTTLLSTDHTYHYAPRKDTYLQVVYQ